MPRKSASKSAVDKIIPRLPTGYAEDLDGADEARLRQEILRAVDSTAEVKAEREADEKLNAAKDLVKDLNSGYAEALRAQSAKIDYCKHLLLLRGKDAAGE